MRAGEAGEGSTAVPWLMLVGLAVVGLVSIVAMSPAPATVRSVEGSATAAAERMWQEQLRLVDEAVARHDVSAGVRLWHDAYAMALASRRSEAIVAAGEAFVRLSTAAGTPDGGKPNARRAYLAALGLAQRQRSATAVLSVAEAFRALGDREVADYCVRIAAGLPAKQDRR